MDMSNTETKPTTEKIVAYYVLHEDADHDVPQSYAGYSETIRVAAGRYPVIERISRYDRKPYLSVTLPGTCTYAHYGHDSYASARVGKPGETYLQPYAYQVKHGAVAKSVANPREVYQATGEYWRTIAHWETPDGGEIVTAVQV